MEIKWEEHLRNAGYEPRRAELLALSAMFSPSPSRQSGIKAALLEGPPGCGKTSLTQAVSRVLNAAYVYHLLHSWSDDQELYVGVDVGAAVEGDAPNVRQPGVLALAAGASHSQVTVLCLDEVDKVQERTEYLLLDFLQTGRVPVRPGVHLQGNQDNLVVFLTSNGARPLSDALLRRVRRIRMAQLPAETMEAICHRESGVPLGVCRLLRKAAQEVAAKDEATLSLQELICLAADVWRHASSYDDVREYLAQWAARGEAGAAAARQIDLAPLWGEVLAARRGAAKK